jgi:hypothetical protein
MNAESAENAEKRVLGACRVRVGPAVWWIGQESRTEIFDIRSEWQQLACAFG